MHNSVKHVFSQLFNVLSVVCLYNINMVTIRLELGMLTTMDIIIIIILYYRLSEHLFSHLFVVYSALFVFANMSCDIFICLVLSYQYIVCLLYILCIQ